MWRSPWTILEIFQKIYFKAATFAANINQIYFMLASFPFSFCQKIYFTVITLWNLYILRIKQSYDLSDDRGDPSVMTRMSALFSKIWHTTNSFQLTAWGCPLNLYVSLPPVFSRTAHQKQVISELSNALPIMMSSTTASSMNGFLCLMTPTTHVRSSARPKEQPWLLNYPPRS